MKFNTLKEQMKDPSKSKCLLSWPYIPPSDCKANRQDVWVSWESCTTKSSSILHKKKQEKKLLHDGCAEKHNLRT